MASVNKPVKSAPVLTHGGSQAARHLTPIQQLRRTVLACMLFEDQFYEDGQSVADRIMDLGSKVSPLELANLAIEARHEHNLRHVSLLLLVALVRHGEGKLVSDTITKVVSRADELSELLALYWQVNPRPGTDAAGRPNLAPLAKQLKIGLAQAFIKFDAYQLAKYDRAREVRLRDVMFLVHPKPRDPTQIDTFKQLVDNTLPTPDTWETNLSGGADKKETFERLITENNLGYFALLRNLRNMIQAGCDQKLVKDAILARKNGAEKLLPFRFTAAARHAPQFEREIDTALMTTIEQMPQLPGVTAILVDCSGSMNGRLSYNSDMTRKLAAATLASVVNAEHLRVFAFADNLVEVPPRRGMAGVDAISRATSGGTRLFDAIDHVNKSVKYDRIIVITDEQDTGGSVKTCPTPNGIGYMINVAAYKNGVGYGPWVHLDGFSERVLHWIHALEQQDLGAQ